MSRGAPIFPTNQPVSWKMGTSATPEHVCVYVCDVCVCMCVCVCVCRQGLAQASTC